MAIQAYILLKIRPVSVEELRNELSKIPEIKSCSLVTGEIDAILEVEVEDTQRLFEVARKLRDIPYVMETRTSIIISQCK
ncbi:MAG: Lrp/AsnC family transcriptional regulator [Candidatus Njordarchaeia archaeon]